MSLVRCLHRKTVLKNADGDEALQAIGCCAIIYTIYTIYICYIEETHTGRGRTAAVTIALLGV